MFEETNQTQDFTTTDGSDIFDGALDGETNQTEQTTEEATETSTEKTENVENTEVKEQESAQPETYKVKYNGEEKELTLDEVLQNAQKGLNYEHILSERDSLKHANNVIEKYAKMYGMDAQEYLSALEKSFAETNAQKYAEENGVPQDAASEILKLKGEIEELKAEKNNKTEEEKRSEELTRLTQKYPDLKVDEIPQNIFEDAIKNNVSLEQAYLTYENARLKAELTAKKQNDFNNKTSPGSLKDDSGKEKIDEFLQGFLGS